MTRAFIVFAVLGLALVLVAPALCEEPTDYGPGYGYGWGPGCMMGPGSGWGPGHMSPGSRSGGMHGRGWGWDHGHRGPQSMTPDQQAKWDKMWSSYQMDTLEQRKQLAAKQMELETLWAQPDVDPARIDTLSKEVSDLQAGLRRKHDQYLMRCRKDFGDHDWACPGGW
jgi:Spy/CpxP family protein refolding chaperone